MGSTCEGSVSLFTLPPFRASLDLLSPRGDEFREVAEFLSYFLTHDTLNDTTGFFQRMIHPRGAGPLVIRALCQDFAPFSGRLH